MRRLFQQGLPTLGMLLIVALAGSVLEASPPQSSEPAQQGELAISSNGKIFLEHFCVRCHGAEQAESELRLDRMEDLPSPELGRRWQQIRQKVADHEMPPEDARQPDPGQRSELAAWIDTRYGRNENTDVGVHWSFQPLMEPELPRTLPVEPAEAVAPEARGGFDFSEPSVDDRRISNGVDAFILTRLQEHGFSFSPEADRRTLIRRVTLDLIGLPPTRAEVDAFLSDPAPLDFAYERLVERLLQSPRYGERWAQHWLDVIRWAETVGFETNAERPDAWHYRDWVIRALNQDMPYDRFICEQLVGDALASDAALGFLVAGPANLPGQIGRDEEAMRQARQDELDEVIRTVSQSLLGLTIGCARCHDHKFDPISQRDYYAFQAIFAGLSYGDRRLRGDVNDQWTAELPLARKRLALAEEQLDAQRRRFGLREPLSKIQSETFAPIVADAVRMEIDATEDKAASLYEFEIWSAGANSQNVALAANGGVPSASSFALANQTRHFDNLVDGTVDQRQAFPWVSAEGGPAWLEVQFPEARIERITWHAGSSMPASYQILVRPVDTGQWRTVGHTRDRLPNVSDKRKAKDVQLHGMRAEEVEDLLVLLAEIRAARAEVDRLSRGPQTYAAVFSEAPTATWLLRRGDPMQRLEEVEPACPKFLASGPDAERGSTDAERGSPDAERGSSEVDRRWALARHLTEPDHPLTARVLVNRIWQHHFGTGLVKTSSDFGQMGAKPTHPELLDWLATQFVRSGWSWKSLHRLIVYSRAYRQASQPREAALEVDAESSLLWRYPPRRLDAEAIRDSVLAVSGKLNRAMYGRGFDFFDQRGGLSDYAPKEIFDERGWRRMIYAHKIRMQSIDVFGAFDCPDAGQMTPLRSQSITPIQALGLFNSPFVNRQAGFFAERAQRETDGDLGRAVDFVFETALARCPNQVERSTLTELADAHGLDSVCRVILNSSEFLYLR